GTHGRGMWEIQITAPDLTVTKTDNVGGATTLGNSWTWTLTVANTGTGPATFASTQTILSDNLPNSNIGYGTVNFGSFSGITNSGNISGSIAGNDLNVTA